METSVLQLVRPHWDSARQCSDRPLVQVERQDNASRFRIFGPFDALTIREIGPAIERLIEEGPARVTVDLEQVSLMDSSGVSALVSLWKRMTAMGGEVVVENVRDQPLAVLKVLQLDVLLCR